MSDPTPDVKATENGGGRGRSRTQVDALNAGDPPLVDVVYFLLPLTLIECIEKNLLQAPVPVHPYMIHFSSERTMNKPPARGTVDPPSTRTSAFARLLEARARE